MKIRVRSKIWLELDGQALLGDGKERLLRLIDSCGSINAAAREMDITYRKAWGMLQSLEAGLSVPLLQRSKGGSKGGGSSLTEEARQILARYEQLNRDLQDFVDRRFAEVFEDEQ